MLYWLRTTHSVIKGMYVCVSHDHVACCHPINSHDSNAPRYRHLPLQMHGKALIWYLAGFTFLCRINPFAVGVNPPP